MTDNAKLIAQLTIAKPTIALALNSSVNNHTNSASTLSNTNNATSVHLLKQTLFFKTVSALSVISLIAVAMLIWPNNNNSFLNGLVVNNNVDTKLDNRQIITDPAITKQTASNPTVSLSAQQAIAKPNDTTSITVNSVNNADKVLDANGHIIARRVANVSSRVTGKLNALMIEEGQTVQKNEVIAQVDDEQAKLDFAIAQAALTQQQARLNQFNIAIRYNRKRLTRMKTLVEQQLVSQQQLDNAQQRLQSNIAKQQSQQAQIALSQRRLAATRYQLEQHKIRAPFTGVVISKNAQVGELISAGNSGGSIRTGVGTIVDMKSLEIEVEVSENYISRIHAGQAAIATLDAYPNWPIKSEVVAIIPTANRQKASIRVRVKFTIKDPRILPDMAVKVSFYKKNVRTKNSVQTKNN